MNRTRGLAVCVAFFLLIGAAPVQETPDTRDYLYWCRVTVESDHDRHSFVTRVRRMSTPAWISDPRAEPMMTDPRESAWEQTQCARIERAAGRRIEPGARKGCSCWSHGVTDADEAGVREMGESVRDWLGPDRTTLVD